MIEPQDRIRERIKELEVERDNALLVLHGLNSVIGELETLLREVYTDVDRAVST